VLPNIDGGESRDLWIEHGWEHRQLDSEQLYDNLFDPVQARNVAADPELASVKAELADSLQQWMEETNDPLLDGDVPLPPGAQMNDVSSRSPDDELLQADADGNLVLTPNLGVNA
jgi:hypothetical protein